ncbi:unnamed protein product [Trifolium pratense]|uniref:Uncharacterized protein n=1 Tax=Trifolium pratense TaxID=57577 RepID=A0ACB0K736_TRIPR|nr:unnamed protein product [Trifolium pratense]
MKNLPPSEKIESCSVAGLGFVNIVLSKKWIAQSLQKMLTDGIDSWAPRLPIKRVLVDFSSPNTAKEMHVGHLRTLSSECRFNTSLRHVRTQAMLMNLILEIYREGIPSIARHGSKFAILVGLSLTRSINALVWILWPTLDFVCILVTLLYL